MAFPRARQCSGWFTRNPESSSLCHPFRLCPATTRASADFGVSFQVNESSTIPRKLSRSQRELVNKLAESLTVDNKPASPGLLEKMKDLFN